MTDEVEAAVVELQRSSVISEELFSGYFNSVFLIFNCHSYLLFRVLIVIVLCYQDS